MSTTKSVPNDNLAWKHKSHKWQVNGNFIQTDKRKRLKIIQATKRNESCTFHFQNKNITIIAALN